MTLLHLNGHILGIEAVRTITVTIHILVILSVTHSSKIARIRGDWSSKGQIDEHIW